MKNLNFNKNIINANIKSSITADDHYIIIGVEDGWIKVDKKIWQQYQQLKEKDRSIRLEHFYETKKTYNK